MLFLKSEKKKMVVKRTKNNNNFFFFKFCHKETKTRICYSTNEREKKKTFRNKIKIDH